MKRFVIVLAAGSLLFHGSVFASSDTEFNIKILPIECLFEIVNDGTGEIIYLNPEKCGEFAPPPPDDDEPGPIAPTPTDPSDPETDRIDDFGIQQFFRTPIEDTEPIAPEEEPTEEEETPPDETEPDEPPSLTIDPVEEEEEPDEKRIRKKVKLIGGGLTMLAGGVGIIRWIRIRRSIH